MKEKIYTVSAELGAITCSKTFEQVNDEAAMFEAMGFVLDEAHLDQKGPWALGRIVLANAKGKVLHEMAAKVA